MFLRSLFILGVAALLEGSVTTLPLTLSVLIILYCFYRADWIFVAAFIAGVFLDIFLIRSLGVTSMVFLTCLVIIFFYQRKFEITSFYFVFIALFIGILLYTFFFPIQNNLFIASLLALFGSCLFRVMYKPQISPFTFRNS